MLDVGWRRGTLVYGNNVPSLQRGGGGGSLGPQHPSFVGHQLSHHDHCIRPCFTCPRFGELIEYRGADNMPRPYTLLIYTPIMRSVPQPFRVTKFRIPNNRPGPRLAHLNNASQYGPPPKHHRTVAHHESDPTLNRWYLLMPPEQESEDSTPPGPACSASTQSKGGGNLLVQLATMLRWIYN